MYNMALVTNRLEQHTDITTPARAAFEGAGLCGGQVAPRERVLRLAVTVRRWLRSQRL